MSNVLQEMVDLSPRGIRETLGLNKPIYERTSSYGHFGRAAEEDGGFSRGGAHPYTEELKSTF